MTIKDLVFVLKSFDENLEVVAHDCQYIHFVQKVRDEDGPFIILTKDPIKNGDVEGVYTL